MLLCCCVLPLNGCGSEKAESSTESSVPAVTSAAPETTEPPMTTTLSLTESGAGKAAAYLLNAGEMKLPASENDEKNGMLFRFTGVSAQTCTVTWDAYRVTDFANGVGKAITVNGSLCGNVTCSYVPVTDDSGRVTAVSLEGVTVTRNEANGGREYGMAVDLSADAPALMLRNADGETLPLTKFAPEMNEYEWVSFASAQETGDDAMGGESDLFSVSGNLLLVDGSLFGSPQQEVETRIGYSVGTPQPFNEWSVPLQRTEFLYGGLDLFLVFRDGSLTSVYVDSPIMEEDYSIFDYAANDANARFGGAPDSVFQDENDNYVESWYLPEENTTLYMYLVYDEATEGYVFRQQYTVGKTDRFCGF